MFASKKIGKNILNYFEDVNKKTYTCEQIVDSWDNVVDYTM